MAKYIYCRDINLFPDILPNRNCVLGCCVNIIKITIPEEEITNTSPKKQLDLIFLNTYQRAQILASDQLNMARHTVSEKN